MLQPRYALRCGQSWSGYHLLACKCDGEAAAQGASCLPHEVVALLPRSIAGNISAGVCKHAKTCASIALLDSEDGHPRLRQSEDHANVQRCMFAMPVDADGEGQ
mmetsp:Transcript_94202/g.293019  ORF Transcript_94202/g.293019 Transcript_94202/m.293019 type:complete len:104 (+) Transcript_94202:1623-1934(+)